MTPKVIVVATPDPRPVLIVDRHGKPLVVAEIKRTIGFKKETK